MQSVNSVSGMLNGSDLSVANYDATLRGWESQDLVDGRSLGAGGLQFCGAAAERAAIIADDGWTITGDSQALSCFTVGGMVTGLEPGNTLVLQNNGEDDLLIGNDGAFTFSSALLGGSAYAVTVLTQPTNPIQTCTVSNANGTLIDANIMDVMVNCQPVADLSITLFNGVSSLDELADVTYTIQVNNLSSSDVFGAEVINLLPPELDAGIATWSCTPSAGSLCSATGTGDIIDAVDIPGGGTLTYTLDTIVLGMDSDTIINTAQVISPEAPVDPDLSNNTATDVDAIGLFADDFENEDG